MIVVGIIVFFSLLFLFCYLGAFLTDIEEDDAEDDKAEEDEHGRGCYHLQEALVRKPWRYVYVQSTISARGSAASEFEVEIGNRNAATDAAMISIHVKTGLPDAAQRKPTGTVIEACECGKSLSKLQGVGFTPNPKRWRISRWGTRAWAMSQTFGDGVAPAVIAFMEHSPSTYQEATRPVNGILQSRMCTSAGLVMNTGSVTLVGLGQKII
ncbi:hypothetical protein FB451DRAFT_1184730 [Mycena latifolia]|nr:hypothetical protein FB451DRAFT_1184730 [Mycena latifolia]